MREGVQVMAFFGLPSAAELPIILIVMGIGLVLPWFAMYRLAKRAGTSGEFATYGDWRSCAWVG